jgi:hypothetical protein
VTAVNALAFPDESNFIKNVPLAVRLREDVDAVVSIFSIDTADALIT